ncbi:MAG TPA: hypothetical protein VIU15_24905 [Streptomyces sp.]
MPPTLTRSQPAAEADARTTAATALDDAGITCQNLTVTTHATFQPGSMARVVVTCTVGLEDLALLQVPGATTLTAEAESPVDVYRSRALGFTQSDVSTDGGLRRRELVAPVPTTVSGGDAAP